MSEFLLPDVGEGLTEAEIVSWHVAVGDEVKVNDVLVDIETAKSIVELPSPFAGRVDSLLVEEGATVAVGTAIVSIGSAVDPAEEPERHSVLVGYGPSERRRRTRRPVGEDRPTPSIRVLAKPPVRKLAKDLGIDLASVPCDGPTVTRADVEAFVRPPDHSAVTPLSGVRRATAEAMIASVVVPQATVWVTADVTATVDLMERLRADGRFAGVKVTSTLLVAKAVCLALARTPELQGIWRDTGIEHPASVGLGIAAATERGLVVPVVPAADTMSMIELGQAIDHLVATARDGRLQPAQQAGGTFTLTNVGVFGVDGGTPILPPGQSGILALGQIARRPWVVDAVVVPRWVTTLAVTFDHRVTDGEQASLFLADVAALLHDPALALAH